MSAINIADLVSRKSPVKLVFTDHSTAHAIPLKIERNTTVWGIRAYNEVTDKIEHIPFDSICEIDSAPPEITSQINAAFILCRKRNETEAALFRNTLREKWAEWIKKGWYPNDK